MCKEIGDLDEAGKAYGNALATMPEDADLAVQIGHLRKLQGRYADAADSYRRALHLKPGWNVVERELAAIAAIGLHPNPDRLTEAASLPRNDDSLQRETIELPRALRMSAVLAPGAPLHGLHAHGDEIATRRFGRPEHTPWGLRQVLRGVQAFRGFVVSEEPAVTVEIFLNGLLVHRGGLKGGFEIPHERARPLLRRYVFNAWIDLTRTVEGQYEVRFRVTCLDGRTFERVETVVIAAPISQSDLPDSDNDVPPPDPADHRSIDTQVNSRPSMIRPARRAMLKKLPRTVLILRPDVLGDLVVAVPALRRLREVLPGARFVGLFSPANVDLARTLNLFDDILITELSFNSWERRRVVTMEAQKKLADELAAFKFDMAIDLGTSPDSRLLLPLATAPVTVGFRAEQFPHLTVDVTGSSRDPWNGIENVPHTNMAMGLVEWLNVMMRSEVNLLRRDDLSPEMLAAFGLAPDARYVVLHAGGRWQFSRWPHYIALAEMLVAQTDLQIVFMTSDPADIAVLPDALAHSDRFQVVQRRLAFDELDALLSYCSLFIGDDSGVKHLAGMRGAKVIGIQNARNNWSEWGQDMGGYIVTRKVPCAGCLIQNYPESDECGRDFVCITAIRPDEIFEAAQSLLAAGA
jgi:ADP-heptose:LPS heptosyltransferase